MSNLGLLTDSINLKYKVAGGNNQIGIDFQIFLDGNVGEGKGIDNIDNLRDNFRYNSGKSEPSVAPYSKGHFGGHNFGRIFRRSISQLFFYCFGK